MKFWMWVSIIAITGTAIYLMAAFYKHKSDVKRDLELTNELMKANTNENNKVVLVDKENMDEFKERGYRIVYR